MQLEDYRATLSMSSWNPEFLAVLSGQNFFKPLPSQNVFNTPTVVQCTDLYPTTLSDTAILLQSFWLAEQRWYTAGNPHPFQNERGLRFSGKLEIWERQAFQPIRPPRPIDGTELVPNRVYISGVVAAETSMQSEEYAKGSRMWCYRALTLSLYPDMREKQKEGLLEFLANPPRIAGVIGYFKPHYG